MIVDHISNWKTYSLGDAWEKAFAFLSDLKADAAEGEYPIDGEGLFARVMSYQTKEETAPDAILEAHRKFADIHMSLVDAERIAVYPAHELSVKEAYSAERDVEFYLYQAPAALQLSMLPGTFALLLPQDAHMPGLHSACGGAAVKKVVVKIAMDRLTL